MSLLSHGEVEEDRTGHATLESDGDEYDLTVLYHYHEWSEGHSYGQTTAYERLANSEWQELELDDQQVTYDRLVCIFGEDQVNKAINRAMDQ